MVGRSVCITISLATVSKPVLLSGNKAYNTIGNFIPEGPDLVVTALIAVSGTSLWHP